MNKILFLGLGSEILTDDGIGLRIVNDLYGDPSFQLDKNLKCQIDFSTCLTGSLDLLELIKDYDTLIIFDAIKTQNGIPGKVNRFSLNNYKDTIHLQNIHDISFQDTIKLGRSIGFDIPDKVIVFAIEIVDNLTFSSNLSDVLANMYPEILKDVKTQVEDKLQLVSNVY